EHNIKKILDKLINGFKVNNKRFSILREFENNIYKIVISYNDNKGIVMELFKEDNSKISDCFITFDKLKSLSAKINMLSVLPILDDLSIVKSLDIFIERIFIYFTLVSYSKEKLSIGVLSRPIGIGNTFYELTFLKTK